MSLSWSELLVVASIGVLGGLLTVPLWRRLRWWWRRHRQPSSDTGPRFTVYHTYGRARRLYHISDDPRAAKAHYNANNAPRGTVVQFYDRGKLRGRRVQA